MRMSEAPELGARHPEPCPACGNPALRRTLSVPTINREYIEARRKYPYVSRRWAHLDGAKKTPDGHPIIESVRHEREVMARNGLMRE